MVKKANEITITIRILPKGEELDVDLDVTTTGKEIISELIAAGYTPKNDPEGNPYVYELISKINNVKINEDKTLLDSGIQDGTIVYVTPKLVAGALQDLKNI